GRRPTSALSLMVRNFGRGTLAVLGARSIVLLRREGSTRPTAALGLGRVKTLGREEHVERRSSSVAVSSRAMANPLGDCGADRTRFPSVNALSEFSHGEGQEETRILL